MKSLRPILAELDRLEERMKPRFPYVIRKGDTAQMEANRAAGKPFVIMPERCASLAEWTAQYAPDHVALRL